MPQKLIAFDRNTVLPPGAVILSEDDVHGLFWKTVSNWKPQREMWPLTMVGYSSLSIIGFGSGLISSLYFHEVFNLRRHGKRYLYLPTLLLSAIVPPLVISIDITKKMILQQEECPICLELRAGFYQGGLGALYPVFMAAASAMLQAKQKITYPLPDMKQYSQLMGILYKVSKPFLPVLSLMTMTNFAASVALVRYQRKLIHKVSQEMMI